MRLAAPWALRVGAIAGAALLVTGTTAGARGAPTRAEGPALHLAAGRSADVSLQLRPGEERVAHLAARPVMSGYAVWSGSLDGDANSSVTIVQGGGVTNGVVSSPGGAYRLSGFEGGPITSTRVDPRRVDHDVVLGSASASTTGSPATAPVVASASATTGAPTVIDVVIGWTPRAAVQAGGTAAISSLAALAVASTNDAYARSGINVRLNLIATAAGVGTEGTDLKGELAALRNPTDGKWDNVMALREATKADLASLFTSANAASCGVAYYPKAGGADAVSVTPHDCAVDTLAFAHEIGHNLGAGHDSYTDGATSGYYPTFGHGFVHLDTAHPDNSWRTIMAYDTECRAKLSTGYCQRIASFANPDLSFQSSPTGSATADNRRAILTAAPMVAAYRTPSPAPVVTALTPASGVKSVARTTVVTATFDRPVTGVSATTMTLASATGTVPAYVTYDATNRRATLTPKAALAADRVYTLRLTAGITATTGTPLTAFSSTFETGPAPTITALSPKPGATGVSRSTTVKVTFSEAVKNVTTSTVYLTSATGSRYAVSVAPAATPSTWIVKPSAALPKFATVTVHVLGGSRGVTDLAGNPLASTRVWSFTTTG